MAIYDVEKERISDALSFVYRYELEFAGIEGYSNEIETLLTAEEMPPKRKRDLESMLPMQPLLYPMARALMERPSKVNSKRLWIGDAENLTISENGF